MEVQAAPPHLVVLHEALGRFWSKADATLASPPDTTWRLQFATAVAEIGANIVRHAYAGGTKEGAFSLCLRLRPDRIDALFIDWGSPFTMPLEAFRPEKLANVDPLELHETGRGLLASLAALDLLQYRRTAGGTNCWRLVKRLPLSPG